MNSKNIATSAATYTVKDSDGNPHTYTLPAIPRGFRNGAKMRACLRLRLRHYADHPAICKETIAEHAAILNAPRLRRIKYVTEWKRCRDGMNPTCRAYLYGDDAETIEQGTGRADGGGYDKGSAALWDAITGNPRAAAMYARLIIEHSATIARRDPACYNRNGFSKNPDLRGHGYLPTYNFNRRGHDCVMYLFKQVLNWHICEQVDGNTFDVGIFEK